VLQVNNLFDFPHLDLKLLSGEAGLDREIRSPDLNRPGLELTGFFDSFDENRIQIFGQGEIRYLEKHSSEPRVRSVLDRLLGLPVPCVIVARDLEAPTSLLEIANNYQVPVFGTPLGTTRLFKRLYESLEYFFSPSTLIHGTLLDVLGMGVLLLGKSGVGKSECGLELVSKGHSLVADDVVRVVCLGERLLQGESPHLLRHYIEVRGLGIVDLSKLYGIRAIRSKKQIDMVITLEEWKRETHVERLGLDTQHHSILDVELPHIIIPVKPGRNIATIVEVGARDYRLKLMGINSAEEFNERLLKKTRGEALNKLERDKAEEKPRV